MRISVVLATMLIATAAAHADTPSVAFDLGYLWDRVALSDHTAIDGNLVRFGFRVNVGAIHFGAEVDDSWLAGSTTVPDAGIARTMTIPANSPLVGTMVAPKVVFGVHTRGRTITLAADVAGGVRDTGVDADWANDIAGKKMEPLLEARSRIDYWLGSSWTIGAMASSDVLVRNDLAFGVMLASHMR